MLALPDRSLRTLWLAFALVAACGDERPAKSEVQKTPAVVEPADVHFDVTWKESTVQVLRGSDEYARYHVNRTLDAVQVDGADATQWPVGTMLLIEGRGLFKVQVVTVVDEGVLLDVEPGALTDAAERGELEWSVPLSPDSPTTLLTVPAELDEGTVLDKARFDKVGEPRGEWIDEPPPEPDMPDEPAPLPALRDVGGDFSGTINGVKVSGSLKGKGESIDLSASATVQRGKSLARCSIKGSVQGLRHTGRFVFDDGKVQQLEFTMDDIHASFDFDAEGAGVAQDYAINLPWRATFPFMLGPIPMFAGVGLGLEVRSTTQSEDSAKLVAHMSWQGGSGFKLQGTEVVQTGNVTASEGATDSAVHSSVFSSGLAVNIVLPKLELGVGVASFAAGGDLKLGTSGSLYASFETEEVSNIRVEVNLATAEKRWCRETTLGWGAFGGAELKLFSFSLKNKILLSQVQQRKEKEGPHCE